MTKKQVNVENQAIFITDDMLIVGCDIGSETHYIRAIDVRGRVLGYGAFEFSNTSEGFENARAWVLKLAAKKEKKQIIKDALLVIPTYQLFGTRYHDIQHSRLLF